MGDFNFNDSKIISIHKDPDIDENWLIYSTKINEGIRIAALVD